MSDTLWRILEDDGGITTYDVLHDIVADQQYDAPQPLYRTGYGGHPNWVILWLAWNATTSQVDLASMIDFKKAVGTEFTIGVPVAQVDTVTFGGTTATVGEEFDITINGTLYQHVAAGGETPAALVAAMQILVDADDDVGAADSAPDLVITATVPGVAFTDVIATDSATITMVLVATTANDPYNIYPATGTPTAPTWGDPDSAGGLIFGNDGEWLIDLGFPALGAYPQSIIIRGKFWTTESGAANSSHFTVGGAQRLAGATRNNGSGCFKDGAGAWKNPIQGNGSVFAGSARTAPVTGRVSFHARYSSNKPTANTMNSTAHAYGSVFGQGIPRAGPGGAEATFGFDGGVIDKFYVERNGFTAMLETLGVSGTATL